MANTITKEILRHIESYDPDGGSQPPTDADYIAFRRSVIGLYGKATWDYYIAGGWA